jgi:hypothetical protein
MATKSIPIPPGPKFYLFSRTEIDTLKAHGAIKLPVGNKNLGPVVTERVLKNMMVPHSGFRKLSHRLRSRSVWAWVNLPGSWSSVRIRSWW